MAIQGISSGVSSYSSSVQSTATQQSGQAQQALEAQKAAQEALAAQQAQRNDDENKSQRSYTNAEGQAVGTTINITA